MRHEDDEIPDERDVAFAAANLRAWADHVEATGEGVRVESYAITVDAPIDGAPMMAKLASTGSIGWRHAPKLQHRNQGLFDHGSPWSDHHKHAAHPRLEPLDARGADASEAGFMAIGLKDDGQFSVEEHDIDGWRDGLERWRDPVPTTTPQEAALADFADVTPNPDYTAEDALEFMRKARAGELER